MNAYQRAFILLRPMDGASPSKSGYCKLEVKSGRGKLIFSIQGFTANEDGVHALLLRRTATGLRAIDCGRIAIDNRGMGTLSYDFSYSDIEGAPYNELDALCVATSGADVCYHLVASIERGGAVDWRGEAEQAIAQRIHTERASRKLWAASTGGGIAEAIETTGAPEAKDNARASVVKAEAMTHAEATTYAEAATYAEAHVSQDNPYIPETAAGLGMQAAVDASMDAAVEEIVEPDSYEASVDDEAQGEVDDEAQGEAEGEAQCGARHEACDEADVVLFEPAIDVVEPLIEPLIAPDAAQMFPEPVAEPPELSDIGTEPPEVYAAPIPAHTARAFDAGAIEAADFVQPAQLVSRAPLLEPLIGHAPASAAPDFPLGESFQLEDTNGRVFEAVAIGLDAVPGELPELLQVEWPGMSAQLQPVFQQFPRIYPFGEREDEYFVRVEVPSGLHISHFLLGVAVSDGMVQCICYCIPGENGAEPPAGLEGYRWEAVGENGYWTLWSDAATGDAVMRAQ